MKIETLRDKKIVLVGFGVEGKATLRFLQHYFPNKIFDILDETLDPHYLEKQKDYDLAIRSPGIPKELITIPHTTATNIFFANARGTTIGITGSKGKSTTAALVHTILKEAGREAELCGNIGRPMLETLLETKERELVYVIELSSYQLDDIEYSPHISVILNLFPDHMDYHGGVEHYWNAKKNIVKCATKDDYYIYNPAYEDLKKLAQETNAKSAPFIEALPFPESMIHLLGAHNRDNVRAAVTAAKLFGVSEDVLESAIKKFKSLPHRLEYVGTYRDIIFYDDAISTTPESTILAIESLKNVGTILLGGKDRGYNFSRLARIVLDYKIPNIVLFPESGEKILAELKLLEPHLPKILETRDMRTAVQFAYDSTPRGMICLLSTASPSYTLWKNFEEKGKVFQEAVRELAKK